jgi:hypothetical protein
MKRGRRAAARFEEEDLMRYMCLIYSDEGWRNTMSEAEGGRVLQEFMDFTQSVVKSGHHRAGDRLAPTSSATTIRSKGGKVVTTDGPFAETKEQLGGYYIVKAENLDEARGIAARIPSARFGSIEVRPVMEVG